MPAPYPERNLIRILWHNLAASVLREANSGLPISFTVFVNHNGSVSLTVIDTCVPAAYYSPFFDDLTPKLNQSFPVGDNPGCPSDLPLLTYNSPSMASPSRLTPKTTLACMTSSSPPYLILSPFLFPKPASSTPIGHLASTIRKPSWSGYSSQPKTGSS